MRERDGIPLGFAMALAQNEDALERYSALSAEEKRHYAEMAHNASSKDEMRQIVSDIAHLNNFSM